MMEEALRGASTADDIGYMLTVFLVHCEANIAAESRSFPNVVASLETLAAADAKLAVCTNKREYLARKLPKPLGSSITSRALPGATLSSVEALMGHLTQVVDLAGGVSSQAVMVRTSDADISTAKSASVPSILVSFGYAPEPRGELAPDAILDHFDRLFPEATTLLGASPNGCPHR
jgi:phosphoglycolate phosphatase